MEFGVKHMVIEAAIFDLGKVIVKFDNHIFFRKLAAYCSHSPEEIAELSHRKTELVTLFDSGKIRPGEFYQAVTDRLQAAIGYEEFFRIYTDVFSLIPSTLAILKRLKTSGCRLVLLSNTDVMRYDFIKKKFPEILLFDEYVVSYEVGFLKPHPRIYEEALRKASFPPGQCVFIDDMEVNVEAARRLGMQAVLFTPDTDLEKTLQELGLSF